MLTELVILLHESSLSKLKQLEFHLRLLAPKQELLRLSYETDHRLARIENDNVIDTLKLFYTHHAFFYTKR